jgi:hypothetical protein
MKRADRIGFDEDNELVLQPAGREGVSIPDSYAVIPNALGNWLEVERQKRRLGGSGADLVGED